jgi:hypothetical protein
MSRRFPWNRLGIDQTHDTAAIRKAYADALRAINVDEDIAGYAELRRARDEALWLAAQGQRADDGDLGLGDLDLDDDDDGDVDGVDPVGADYDDDWEWDDSPEAHHPDPLTSGRPDPELTEAQRRAQAAWQSLRDLLYPDGQPSDESVTYAEMQEGLAHLDVLLDRVAEADLIEHDAFDAALADLFASTWPRSAPFVEPANEALHWLDEAGHLEERPALRFLNQRLKGMRFHEKIQAADHPLHKAWMELARPGRASFIDRLRIKRLEVDKLLTGVRQHYPELETYLDPQRVASWEGSSAGHGVGDTGPKTVRWITFVLLALFILPRFIGILTDPRPDDSPPIAQAFAEVKAVEVDIAVNDIFGAGLKMNDVRAADTVFADQLRSALNRSTYSDVKPLDFVRLKALTASEVADFETLVARAELRRLWLAAAARQPAGACQNVNSGDFTSIPLELTDKERMRERELLRRMLDSKVLNHQPKGGSFQYAIPGWMVGEVIDRSGLSEAAVRKAMGNADDPNRCKIDGLLLDSVLANPGRVSVELLKGV